MCALAACSSPAPGTLPMNWQPVAALNAGLPPGVQVFAGHNPRLPLTAWYVRVREYNPHLTTHVVVSGDSDRRETASSFARHVGLLMVDSVMTTPPTSSVRRDGLRYPLARAALGFFGTGSIDVAWTLSRENMLQELPRPPAHRPGQPDSLFDPATASHWAVREALAGGPVLVSRGAVNVTADQEVFFGTSIPRVHPRTAAGYTVGGDLILLVVDGRQDGSRGVDLQELAILMRNLGCVEALNLDGGGSSTLVVNGQLVNRPAGGTVEREVMSALAVFCGVGER